MSRVLYIAGWGRSGSTILDNVLGQLDGFFSVGELAHLWGRGLHEGRLCGCGTPVRDCELWSRVLARAFPEGVDADRMLALSQRAARTRHLALLLAGRPQGSNAYRESIAALYEAIHAETGSRVVVDSSKSPAYAGVLAGVPGLDLRVVQLVRDPRAVAHSWLRRKVQRDDPARVRDMRTHGAAASSFYWAVLNEATRLGWRREPQRLLVVRYEDFADDPQATVDRIRAFADEPPQALPWTDDGRIALGATHTVSGNPSRFDHGPVDLRPDVEWEDALAPRDRRVVEMITAPFRGRYGYS